MGARVGRLYKNFNLEARAHREIGKSKPEAAPRHPVPINQNNSVPPGISRFEEAAAGGSSPPQPLTGAPWSV
ncbi:hypothetical protein HF521_008284 [Silurus meridionalis]|uniref:NADH dehydrogenase [ubiquinone] 1 alpha subcomplex assembly factor 4 n=1 Tax=Silurus meridionalis TaxID=175797 RepID=A0A8T0ARB0_SILME|nr:hypothetical protein HF521_008284 [Silurus meridionalis]